MSDVQFGCVLELKQDRLYTAERGGAARIKEGDKDWPVDLTLLIDLDRMSWSFELAGRPLKLITEEEVRDLYFMRGSLRGLRPDCALRGH